MERAVLVYTTWPTIVEAERSGRARGGWRPASISVTRGGMRGLDPRIHDEAQRRSGRHKVQRKGRARRAASGMAGSGPAMRVKGVPAEGQ